MTPAEARAAAAAEEEAALNAPYDPTADDSEAEADDDVAYARQSQRANGKPHVRLCSLFNTKGPAALYSFFLLELSADWNSTTVQT
jgi:hypothetical protein